MRALLIALIFAVGTACQATAAEFEKGQELYSSYCAECHGADGKAGQGYGTPIWGEGTLIKKFATAKGLFEYLQFLMPFDDPSKITDEQRWTIISFMLAEHGAIERGKAVDPSNAAEIVIP